MRVYAMMDTDREYGGWDRSRGWVAERIQARATQVTACNRNVASEVKYEIEIKCPCEEMASEAVFDRWKYLFSQLLKKGRRSANGERKDSGINALFV